jgi:hypothetical protein
MTSYTDNLFGETAFNNSRVKFGAPHAVDFGQNAQHAPDGRLYIVGHGGESPLTHQSWMQGVSVYLARTVGAPDPATVNTPEAWEFYAGGAGAAATWDPAIAHAKPIALWMTRGGVTTMSYHPALAKFIMVISTPTVSPSMVGPFDSYFLESDFVTGPWAYVAYIPQFGPEAYFVHIPTKFMGNETVAHAPGVRRVAKRVRPHLKSGERIARARQHAEALGTYAYGLKKTPYAERKARLQADAPMLAQQGFTPEQIAAFDPTDGALDSVVTSALAVSRSALRVSISAVSNSTSPVRRSACADASVRSSV